MKAVFQMNEDQINFYIKDYLKDYFGNPKFIITKAKSDNYKGCIIVQEKDLEVTNLVGYIASRGVKKLVKLHSDNSQI